MIADAVHDLDTPLDKVMGILLCLRPGTTGTTLAARRAHAAEVLGIKPETFRIEKRHERRYVTELALTIYQRVATD